MRDVKSRCWAVTCLRETLPSEDEEDEPKDKLDGHNPSACNKSLDGAQKTERTKGAEDDGEEIQENFHSVFRSIWVVGC